MPPTYLFVGDEMLTVFLQLLNVILPSLLLAPTIPPIYHVLPVIVPLLVQFSNFELLIPSIPPMIPPIKSLFAVTTPSFVLLVMVTVLPVALPTMPPTYLSPVTEP